MSLVLRTMSEIFTAGNKEEQTEQKDGHITSILLVTTFSAIVFACFQEESYFTSKWLFSTSQYTIALLIMLVLLLLSLFLWIFMYCFPKYRSECLSAPRHDPVSALVCILYGLFGFGTMIVHLLTVIIDIGCYKDNNIYAVSATGRVLHVVFLCVQIISIWRFSRFTLKRNLLVNYSLSAILITNAILFLWISFGYIYGIVPPDKSDANHTTNNNRTKDSCYWMSPITTHFLSPLHGITFALQQEYYLLSICLIASMFPRIGSIHNRNKNHVIRIGNTDDNSQPLAAFIKVKQRRQLHIGCKNILIALSSTTVFVPGLVVLILKKTCSFNDGLFYISPMCVALPELAGIAVMLVGFHFLRKSNVVGTIAENNGGYLMNNDAIFILSSVGVIVRNCIVLVFAITVRHSMINVISCILFMIEIYYQTILIISLKTINIKRVKTLQCVVLWLIMPNCLWWMYNRFVSLDPNLDEANELMVGLSWSFLRYTILPVSGFYRFQAFVLLYRSWKSSQS